MRHSQLCGILSMKAILLARQGGSATHVVADLTLGLGPSSTTTLHQALRRSGTGLEQVIKNLRDTGAAVGSVAAARGYASQSVFAVPFRRLSSETAASDG